MDCGSGIHVKGQIPWSRESSVRQRCTNSDQARATGGSGDSISRAGTWAWKGGQICGLCGLRGHFVA